MDWCLGKYFKYRNMRQFILHKHETWDLTPHSRQLLWSQRREQWNTNAGLGVRMREGKLDLQLPLWGTSTQSTSCKLNSFLAASPSWLCRSEKAVDTGFISEASVKSLGRWAPNTVELGSVNKDLQDWTRTTAPVLSRTSGHDFPGEPDHSTHTSWQGSY